MNSKTVTNTWFSYSRNEEIANIITHALGIILGLTFFGLLIVKGLEMKNGLYLLAISLYSFTFIWTYTTSTIYHSAFNASVPRKNLYHLLDHTAIYLFIAGTYTPVAIFALPGGWSYGILSAIWILAILGVIFKFYSMGKWQKLSTIIYLLMGWMIIIAAKPLYETAPIELIYWVALGGLFYTLGTYFFHKDKLKYNHAIWHLFVLGGSVCHFIAIYFHLYPHPAAVAAF